MQKRTYEKENDYILDVLEKAEDELVQHICDCLPQPIKFEFEKLLSIRNAIEAINVKYAFDEGICNKIV